MAAKGLLPLPGAFAIPESLCWRSRTAQSGEKHPETPAPFGTQEDFGVQTERGGFWLDI